LVEDGTIFSYVRVLRGYHTFAYDTPMVRSGAVVMHVVSGETPVTDLPQETVIFVMVGQVLIVFEAVWKRSGRPGLLTFLTRKEVNASL
jgi:hypothetical protein